MDPPDLDDLAEKSSRFFFATGALDEDCPGALEVDAPPVPSPWSVEEELCRDGDRWMAGGEDVLPPAPAPPREDEAGGGAGERPRSGSSREFPRSVGKGRNEG